MFDLSKSTADWLGDLRQSEAFEEADLEELESHLKDEMGQLMDKGLSEKETFWVATSRLGNREELPAEYAKTNSRAVWRRRFLWMAVGVLAFLVLSPILGILSDVTAMITELTSPGQNSATIFGPGFYPGIIVVLSSQVALASAALLTGYLVLTRESLGIASRYRRMRRSRTGTVALCLILLFSLAFLIVLPWLATPLVSRNLTAQSWGNAAMTSAVGTGLFTLLLAAALVISVFVLSRPRKSELRPSVER